MTNKTKPPLDDEQICEAVAAALTADGLKSDGIYTGGGIWCIQIAESTWRDAAWLVGNGGNEWGGCLENAEGGIYTGPDDPGGEAMQLLCTDVSSESQDIAAIAGAIARAIRAWRSQTHGGGR